MIAVLPRPGLGIAILASIAGIAVGWFTATPFGLLAPASALLLHARGRAVWLFFMTLVIGLAGSALAARFHEDGMLDAASSGASFFAVALCMGAVIATSRPATSPSCVDDRFPGAADDTSGRSDTPDRPPSLRCIHPDDRPAAARAAAYAFWTGVPQVMAYRQRQADGSYRWAEFRAEPGYSVSVDVDATVSRPDERWTTSSFLGETAEAVRAAKVIESLHGKAWAFDAAGRFTYVTPVAQTVIGMTLEDLNAPVRGGSFVDGGDVGWSRGVHPDDYDRVAASLRHCLKTGEHWNVEYRMLRTTGLYVWHRVSARPTRDSQGHITGWYGTSIDMDVYKKTEAALRDRERELSQLVDLVPSYLWRLSAEGEPNFFNKRLIDFFGVDIADMDKSVTSPLAAIVEAVVHPDDVARVRKALESCFATGERFSMKYRLRRADGVYRWVDGRAEPLRDQGGNIVHWYGFPSILKTSCAPRRRCARENASFWQLVETLPAMIDCAAPDGEPIYRSQQLRDFLGYDLDDTGRTGEIPAGRHARRQCSSRRSREAVKERYAHSLATGEPYARRHRLRRFDGEYRWVETRAAPMRNADGDDRPVERASAWISKRGSGAGRTAHGPGQPRACQPGGEPRRTLGVDRARGQPAAGGHRREFARLPTLAHGRAAKYRARAENRGAHHPRRQLRRRRREPHPRPVQAIHDAPRPARRSARVIAEARDLMAEEAGRRRIRIDVGC